MACCEDAILSLTCAAARGAGYLSWRSHVWTDVDPDRTGTLPFVWEPGFGFESYVDYALDVPMYFLYREGVYQDATQQRGTFREFLEGRLYLAPGALVITCDAKHIKHGATRWALVCAWTAWSSIKGFSTKCNCPG